MLFNRITGMSWHIAVVAHGSSPCRRYSHRADLS